MEKINNHYGESLNFNIKGTAHKYPFGNFDFFKRFFYIISHFLWSRKVVNQIDLNNESHSFFTRSDWVFYFYLKKMPQLYSNAINIQK